jgi:hypothetical protein
MNLRDESFKQRKQMTQNNPRIQHRRVLFARVGWMRFYNGPVPGDERPVGGGRYNETEIGHEVYNFKETGGRLYGYFQPTMAADTVALNRIDADAIDGKLSHVLVIFVARRPNGGQVIVGWYKDAEVSRDRVSQSPGKPRGFGHFCSAARSSCILLPDENRSLEIPTGKGGMGQANVCYPLAPDGTPKEAPWIQDALEFVDDYQASDILASPEADAEEESAIAVEKALARSKGQGFARTAEERKALEEHAMTAAKKHFQDKGFKVKDVSAKRPYDLLCTKGNREIHVEVKGTTTDGEKIVLTNNEVKHACETKNSCALFVFHSISIKGTVTSGGQQDIIDPWELQNEHLTPVSYTYRIR